MKTPDLTPQQMRFREVQLRRELERMAELVARQHIALEVQSSIACAFAFDAAQRGLDEALKQWEAE